MTTEPTVPDQSDRAEAAPAPPPPELLPALARFERGDFRGAAADAAALLAAQPGPEVESAARTLLARVAPDPWALRLGLLALTLLAMVAAIFAH
jgi:hypothetical protein